MDSYQISYTDEALQDLRDIYDYISAELKSPGVAVAQVRRIRDEVRSLNIFPYRYKAVDWKPWMMSKCGRCWWITSLFSMLSQKKYLPYRLCVSFTEKGIFRML